MASAAARRLEGFFSRSRSGALACARFMAAEGLGRKLKWSAKSAVVRGGVCRVWGFDKYRADGQDGGDDGSDGEVVHMRLWKWGLIIAWICKRIRFTHKDCGVVGRAD